LGGIEIVAVQGKQALNEFVEVPFTLCRNEPHWVPPLRIAVKELLDREKHPFYANAQAEFFLARQNGRKVRITLTPTTIWARCWRGTAA